MKKYIALSSTLAAAAILLSRLIAAETSSAYTVEDIATPPDVAPECGGISFLPDGRLVAAFHRGEIYFYTPATKEWKQFAEGLHDPMGVLAISPTEIIVAQRPELTRLTDTNGDGVADKYECISDAWGMSGNYHEFVCTPGRDPEGNYYVSVTSGSNGSVARYEMRGPFNRDGYLERGHFSVVPWRGWVIKVAPDGKTTPIASGFRQPNGLGVDPQGRVFVSDNQGDWVGTSKLHHILPGRFYGHIAGTVWRDDFKRKRSVTEYDQMRTEGAVLFPHAIMANSPGQPAFDTTDGKFGPFSGQMFVPEFNIPRITRVMIDEVAGEVQGAVTTLFDGSPMRPGTHRLAFAPDGSLWCAQSQRRLGWPASSGIQRLVWNGQTPMDVQAMNITDRGFRLTFTKPVQAESVRATEGIKARRYYYEYHEDYGSPQTDVHEVKLSDLQVSADGRQVTFAVDALAPGYIYELTLNAVKAADGSSVANPLICYTANQLLDGSKAPVPRPKPTGETKGSGKDKPKAATR